MKTALFGGSFNPLHEGHLSLARAVLEETDYQKILFIPAAQPPHKRLEGGADAQERLEMLHLATSDLDWAEVWDGEIRRGGTSYSIDTVRQLRRERLVDERPGLIIGDDLVRGFARWKAVDELVMEAEIILARRSADSASAEFPYECVRLANPLWTQSSTDIRRIIARGGRLEGLVPPPVASFIVERGLYGHRG